MTAYQDKPIAARLWGQFSRTTEPFTVRYLRVDAFPLYAPKRPGDVGYDLPVVVWWDRQNRLDRLGSWVMNRPGYLVWPGQVRSLPSGVALGLPRGMWARIDSRSSARNRCLDVCGGRVIDTGYRGVLVSVVRNIGWLPRFVAHGERVAQVIFELAITPSLLEVDHLDDTERGRTGFGSTGR